MKEQIKLRENALQQAETLMEYKRAICHHPSHSVSRKNKNNRSRNVDVADRDGGGILSIFVSLLAEPLSKTGTSRTDADHLTIELVLHLFRNLLQVEPLLLSSSESAYKAKQLHNELISLLERELVLEILLVLGGDLESRENQPYNLLVMELLHHLLRNQDPTAVARSYLSGTAGPSASAAAASSSGGAAGSAVTSTKSSVAAPSRLRQQLAREKHAIHQVATSSSRHSHFGGTLVVSRDGGAKRQLISANRLGDKRRNIPTGADRRRNKKMEPFIGNSKGGGSNSGRSVPANADDASGGNAAAGPAQIRAWKSLDNFCMRFVTDCYGPVMKSLKNEFRRDSVRLEEGDRAVFFRIVWFFCQWYRVSGRKRLAEKNQMSPDGTGGGAGDRPDKGVSSSSSSSVSLGPLIFTMDIFTFKLTLEATDHFQQHKKYPRLAQSVALLSEMMHLLNIMYSSKEPTEQVMALGLMDRLFYTSEPLDRLPKLLSAWEPGSSTREYLCDLVELCHMTLKLLETNAKACEEEHVVPAGRKAGSKKKGKDDESVDAKKFDTIAKMKATAADFDVTAYVSRKIVSNHTVFMYTQLLSQYAFNAPHTNHRIMALLLRLAKIKVALPDDDGDDDPDLPKNPLAAKTVTLEPMLYNIQLLAVLDKILNDKAIRSDRNYSSLLTFASTVVHNFAKAAEVNPVLFVEALFRHPLPHRFCDLSTNIYVSEELRLIADRDLLLEEQQRLEEADAAEGQDGGDVAGEATGNSKDDDDEDELEFEDFGITGASEPSSKTALKKKKKKKRLGSKKNKWKAVVEDSGDDSSEESAKRSESGTRSGSDSSDDDIFSNRKPVAKKKGGTDEQKGKRKRTSGGGGDDSGNDSVSEDDMDDDELFGSGTANTKVVAASTAAAASPGTSTSSKKARLDTEDEEEENNVRD